MPRVQTHVNLHKSFFLNTGVSCICCYEKQQKNQDGPCLGRHKWSWLRLERFEDLLKEKGFCGLSSVRERLLQDLPAFLGEKRATCRL